MFQNATKDRVLIVWRFDNPKVR